MENNFAGKLFYSMSYPGCKYVNTVVWSILT